MFLRNLNFLIHCDFPALQYTKLDNSLARMEMASYLSIQVPGRKHTCHHNSPYKKVMLNPIKFKAKPTMHESIDERTTPSDRVVLQGGHLE